MKRYYYFILVGLVTLAGVLGFGVINGMNQEDADDVIMGKEMAYLKPVPTSNFSSDSSKVNEKTAELNSELVKLNAELEALEDEVEVVHEETQASYYHDKFNGKKTASGDVFSNKKYTAAHKTLPFGTKIRVTNLSNDEEVIVEVNDRGPFAKGRQLDLSKTAFMDLTHHRSHGTLKVRIEVLPDNYEEKRSEIEDEINLIAGIPDNLDLNEFSL